MKRQRLLALMLMTIMMTVIVACVPIEPTKYQFNGKEYDEETLEEHLSDLIEIENPELDIEVKIYQESDD